LRITGVGGGGIRHAGVLFLVVLAAVVVGTGCGGRSRGAGLYPELVQYSGREIDAVRFEGAEPFGADTLLQLIETQPSQCSLLGLPLCLPFTRIGQQTHRLNLETVRQDVGRLMLFYRASGYFGTEVRPIVDEEDDEEVRVTFEIERGDPITLDTLEVEGTAPVFEPDSIARRLKPRPGQIFNLGQFTASADTVLRALQQRGYAYARVLRNYDVDTLSNRAVATLTAVPGPQVVVDSIEIIGLKELERRDIIRQLTFRKGDVLQLSRLTTSQRNLYGLQLVSLGTVTLAPDSLDTTPADSSRATILVRVAETSVNQADAAIGYGSVECLRTEAEWTNRDFGGGGRVLVLNGSLSKIGLGGATQSGVGESLCRAFDQDTFQNMLDYRISADITQPYFLRPGTQLSGNVFAERLSEPSVFLREAVGGRAAVIRRLGLRRILTTSLDVERASTMASPALYCVAFLVCEPDTISTLSDARYRNKLGVNYAFDDTDMPLDPTRGTLFRTGVAWAAPWLGSDVRFLRWTGEAARYRAVKPGWIAATSLRLGTFFKSASIFNMGDFLPPDERFYAGGANTVRGYARNTLGPGVYVTDEVTTDPETGRVEPSDGVQFVPIGGTALAIANAELRFPSPFYPQRLRLAAFVDAGTVSSGNLWEFDEQVWRITPGVGLRINTPVGPARLDAAFNPYPNTRGPLFLATEDGALVRVNDSFQTDRGGFFSRFRLHLAIGQAF